MNNNNTAKKVAELLLSIKAFTFRFDPPYIYTNGLKSPVYLDNRLVMSYPEVRDQIIAFYIETIKQKIGLSEIDWISATATAAIPQGAWIADRLQLPMVYVRPSAKGHGKQAKVEGYIEKGSNVLIVEDHVSTAGSLVGNAQSIRELGGIVQYCIATTTYETQKSQTLIKENTIELITLTTGKIIVETALENGQITQKEKDSIDVWFTDPPSWAKKMGFE